MTANVRIGLSVAAFLVTSLVVTAPATAEQGMGGSGGKASSGGAMSGKGGSEEGGQKQPDTTPQAGSPGQQGMKGPGSPMEKDKTGDKMIDEKNKGKGKK